MRAAVEFPIDLLSLNFEEFDAFQEGDRITKKDQAFLPLTLTSSLCADEEMLLDDFDYDLPLSPSSPSLYERHTPATTPVESRCGTPGWSTPHAHTVSTPGATPTSSLTCTPSPSLAGSPCSMGFLSQSVGSLSPGSQSGAGEFCPTQPFTDRSVSPAQPSTSWAASSCVSSLESAAKIPRHKRKSHIRAEHKRRFKIQNGFETVKILVPSIANSPSSSKDSKSVVLKKTADYVRELGSEHEELSSQVDALRAEIASLTADISQFQSRLPASGVDIKQTSSSASSSSRDIGIEKMFDDYVRARICQNWKFWIFSMIARPLFHTYNRVVQTSTWSTFTSSLMSWFESHCSLISLRPVLLITLRELSTQTSILTAPERLPQEALQAALSQPSAATPATQDETH